MLFLYWRFSYYLDPISHDEYFNICYSISNNFSDDSFYKIIYIILSRYIDIYFTTHVISFTAKIVVFFIKVPRLRVSIFQWT